MLLNAISGQREYRLVHVCGTGGIGKTVLLREVEMRAAQREVEFLLIDGESAFYSPSQFTESLFFLLEEHGLLEGYSSRSISLAACLAALKVAAESRQIVLAVDSYEHVASLDNWFRRSVIEPLLPQVVVILAGRQSLKGEWVHSPAWRRMIKELHLKEFDYSQTASYLTKFQISQHHRETIWRFAKGHPLTLSLVAALPETSIAVMDKKDRQADEVFESVARRWLKEVNNPYLDDYIEAASILRKFDQAVLSYLMQTEPDNAVFFAFTELSFVKKTGAHWSLHELFRNFMAQDFKKRNGEKHGLISQRAIQYYMDRLMSSKRSATDFAELFYHIGNEKIKAAFFQDLTRKSYYVEKAEQADMEDVSTYFQKRKELSMENSVDFYEQDTAETITHFVSEAHNRKENELFFDLEDYKELGCEAFHLLRDDKEGEALGLSVVIPISADTIDYLKTKPVSRAYFRQLSAEELIEYHVEDRIAGWFIRMIDCLDPTDAEARSCLLHELFPLLLSGGRILVSTPLPFYQHLLHEFGFEEVPGATHYDYGKDQPSPTYLLDVRGHRIADYLRRLLEPVTKKPELSAATLFKFTEREQAIVELVLQGYQNGEIAKNLYVTEVTVKKHMTRILKKVQVRNRTQLVRKMMEMNALPFQ
ncbi:hypothetical protein B0X71_04590 [Planococcus lenghuensis]|uniref:HTH luxR-type domain-containing protein n=2 Tax=Planococcus lenghuensis TaxID=2213202 RepID=A0A1Q2KW99_9BACL|nr:LuxR C-terminal-related transcriptional regulator [Planococcus lenghuensis]AQQ52459.1 hypothetical protein B0X71_04590 [Planococcus lenghuensis]